MKEVEYIFNAHGKPLQAHPAWEVFLKTI
jgi:hypothetical protein